MGIKASKVDTHRYFPDPNAAAFVADVQDGNLKRVTEALKSGMDPNMVGNQGFRPLFFVFSASAPDVARALLAAGADPNARLADGSTPLYFAVRMENVEFTRVLLQAKADPNARVENDKPIIHEAIRSDQPEHVRLLARAGADVNVVWGTGTPLYSAVGAMSLEMARTLLELGADVNWRSPGGISQSTAGERLCNMLTRPNFPVRLPVASYPALSELFAAFAKRGVSLPCGGDPQRFIAGHS